MTKQRIYAVKVQTPEPKVRLVRAANVSAAIRHVAESMIHAEVASQDTLVQQLSLGRKVEEAAAGAPREREESAAADVVIPEHAAIIHADAYTSEPAGLLPVGESTQTVWDSPPTHDDRRVPRRA